MKVCVLIFTLCAAASANIFEDGMEYEFVTTTSARAGTMDFSPHSSGFSYEYNVKLQVSGDTINVKTSDFSFSQYTGSQGASEWPFGHTNFIPTNKAPISFSVKLDSNGLFQSLTYPENLSTSQLNVVKAWAQRLQLNMAKINDHGHGFQAKEASIYGDCSVTYTVNDNAILKSISHEKDCENRIYKLVDDWRGYKCTKNPDEVEGLYSSSNTVYIVEKKGSVFLPKAIISSSSVISQFYEQEGLSQLVHTNSTSTLVNAGPSSGDISVSGNTITDLHYEFHDQEYKWDQDRDLKAREPYFGSGNYLEDEPADIVNHIKEGLEKIRNIMNSLSYNKEAIAEAHKYGINNVSPPMSALDYDSLKNLAEELLADKSEEGIFKSNLYNELLGSTGTTASALVVKDLVMENKFDNTRDASRILSSVPFHIRRPNVQLVKEFESLYSYEGEKFIQDSIPLVFAHLVRITCEHAGHHHSEESKKCFESFASKYVKKLVDKVLNEPDHKEKVLALSQLSNIRYGGVAKELKAFIYGETDVKCPHLRSNAIFTVGWDAIVSGNGVDYFFPIFADRSNSHELRISAITMVMHSNPSSTTYNSIAVVLYKETDYEVYNYVFTLLERYANSINPCNHEQSELAKYFLKYMKQYSKFETDYGLGVSKTYVREFQQKKYGYGGSYTYTVVGSHRSFTPLKLGFGVSTNMIHSYQTESFYVHLRIEGLAKKLVKKFKKMDPATWKMEDLENILLNDMNIRARPDQKVVVEIAIMFKGTIVIARQYDDESFEDSDSLKGIFDNLQSLGDTYSINHQRAIQFGSLLYEQPTEIGVPMNYLNVFTVLVDVKATVKRGNHRGLLFRDITYNFNGFAQGSKVMLLQMPDQKLTYAIAQDRIYKSHIPRNFVIGVNPVKKELKLSVKRPSYDEPLMIMMHSHNMVFTRTHTLRNKADISSYCPKCSFYKVVSNGESAAKDRVFLDRENEKVGSYLHGEYFDCELDANRGRVISHAVRAFMPYNKNPRTFANGIRMGIRQIRAYFIFFPRAEKCGAMFRWSESRNNPVNEIEISMRFNFEPNGQHLFLKGRKIFMKALIKAKGKPKDRQYRINVAYEYTPGYVTNNFKMQVQRAAISGLMKDYSMCFSMENKYPDFSKVFMSFDPTTQMELTGKARLRYGFAKDCDSAPGEIRVTFKHETTEESREEAQNNWYYKKCLEQKELPGWRDRVDKYPITEACYYALWDASTARKYSWNIDFVKLTDRMNAIISQFQATLKTGLLPYWDIDPETLPASSSDPHMNVELTFKENDKALDMYVETSQGGQQFNDIPLRLDWYKKMRNLKFMKTLDRLLKYKIINYCVINSDTIKTFDNVTYPYTPDSCWVLASGHCSPNPSYAVFTKKSSGLPLAAKIYIGGHSVEFQPTSAKKVDVLVDGEKQVIEEKEFEHTHDGTSILNIYRLGDDYHVRSFLKVSVIYDGHFIEVLPPPSVTGQHCGLCGNFNRNLYDELEGKDETQLSSMFEMVENYKWKC